LAGKKECIDATFHTPHFNPSTPLLPALTLSAGECKVSRVEGELTGGPALQSMRSLAEAQKWPPSIWEVFSRLLLCRHQFPTWSPLSCRCLQDGYSIWVCRQCSFCLPCPASSDSLSLPRCFVRTTTVTARKKSTVDELNAHVKGNGHQRGVHREKDGLRNLNKHVDRVKRDRGTALDRHVL
jgi:hypothetical protein